VGLIANMLAEFSEGYERCLGGPSDRVRRFRERNLAFGIIVISAYCSPAPVWAAFIILRVAAYCFEKTWSPAPGILNEFFFMYGEDVASGWRLTRQGEKMVFAKNVFIEDNLGGQRIEPDSFTNITSPGDISF